MLALHAAPPPCYEPEARYSGDGDTASKVQLPGVEAGVVQCPAGLQVPHQYLEQLLKGGRCDVVRLSGLAGVCFGRNFPRMLVSLLLCWKNCFIASEMPTIMICTIILCSTKK